METNETASKKSGSYKKPAKKQMEPEIHPSIVSNSGTDSLADQNNGPSENAKKAKEIYSGIKETLHGETHRTIIEDNNERDINLCDWAIPDEDKKDHCSPVKVDCEESIIK